LSPSILLPISDEAAAWTVPLLDDAGFVRGAVIATGGRTRGTYWLEERGTPIRWNDVLDRLRRSRDSLPGIPREPPLRGGRVRVVPLTDRLIFVQSGYAWPTEGPPSLLRVGVLDRDSVFGGRTLADAFGMSAVFEPDLGEPMTDESFRARAGRLYDAMREALRRGDWTAFGEAYEALGTLLARPPR
jgi:hypothetical protein